MARLTYERLTPGQHTAHVAKMLRRLERQHKQLVTMLDEEEMLSPMSPLIPRHKAQIKRTADWITELRAELSARPTDPPGPPSPPPQPQPQPETPPRKAST